ncbi:hypothetical protein ABXT54_02805 [Methylophilaceae bacterium Uisw_099_01]
MSLLKKILGKLRRICNKNKINNSAKASYRHRSFDSMSSILLWMLDGVEKQYPSFRVKGKKVAEIGAGKFLSHAIGLKVLGASKIFSFDMFRQFDQEEALISFSQQIMAKKIYSKCIEPDEYFITLDEIKATELDLIKLNVLGIEYFAPFDFRQYPNGDFFDFIMSYTVMEHVPPSDVSSLLTKTIQTLCEGGKFCHYIDLEDHKNPGYAPFDFLVEDNWSDEDCFNRGNRLRLSDWKNIFDKIDSIEYTFTSVFRRNLDLLPMDISQMSEEELDDIRVSGFLVIGKKCLA